MTRLEKCEILKEKGYTYNPETGKIFGLYGKEIISKSKSGYIQLFLKIDKPYLLYAHHFAWYMVYGNTDFEILDHINRNKSDNSIDNLRIVTSQQNHFNINAKGCSWDKRRNKWQSQIHIDDKTIYVGAFNTEQEAHKAYLEAKKKYHIID